MKQSLRITSAYIRLVVCWISAVGYFAGSVILTFGFACGTIGLLYALITIGLLQGGIIDWWQTVHGFELFMIILVIGGVLWSLIFEGKAAIKEILDTPKQVVNYHIRLYYEFFGHNIKLSLPYHIEAMEKPARIEQGFSWRKLFSVLWTGMVLLAWVITLIGIVWLATS
tara:strand:+ start:244 stop:750 length:507 start_codon:yes stop_codon:yes gene_type:complete